MGVRDGKRHRKYSRAAVYSKRNVLVDVKSMAEKEKVKELLQEERFEEAGKLLVTFGHKYLGVAIPKFAGVLPYITAKQHNNIITILNAMVEEQYTLRNQENIDASQDEKPTETFTRFKEAMVHFTGNKEEEEFKQQEEKRKERETKVQQDKDRTASLFRAAKFTPLPATIKIGVVHGDIVVIGKIMNIEKVLEKTHEIHRLSYTEAIIKNVELLGLRDDRILLPSLLLKKRKRGDPKKKAYEIKREQKAKRKLVTLDKVARMVERRFPGCAIPSTHHYHKPHCYYPLLSNKIYCPPCAQFVMGRVIPAFQKWAILT